MAEGGNDNAPETFLSVETDAAPSVAYVKLDNLDIGSECEIKTESKISGSKLEEHDDGSTQENCVTKFITAASPDCDTKPYADRNIETGLGSLNLVEKVEPEVDVTEHEFIDELELVVVDKDGDTFLHTSIINLSADLASVLIYSMVESEISLDIGNNLHQTPLHLAVLTRQEQVLIVLLSGGASVYQRDHLLRTPMMIACENQSMKMLDLLKRR
jgi:ankyrin repeat protein